MIWGFPKIGGAFLGVPIIRTIVFWGSILGSPYFGKLPFKVPVGLWEGQCGGFLSLWPIRRTGLSVDQLPCV